MTAPAVIGECAIQCRGPPRDYVPPLYLFPELLPFVTHPDSTCPLFTTASVIDLGRSSWRVVELQNPPPPELAAVVKQSGTVRSKLEDLARQGKLNFVDCSDVPAASSSLLPTSTDLVKALDALVDSVPGWRTDAETVSAVVSPHFLNLLAYQRLRQLLANTEACEEASSSSERKRTRSEQKSGRDLNVAETESYPSVNPWEAAQNPTTQPSVSLDAAGPLPELTATLAKISQRVWKTTSSVGLQTDVRKPATHWTRPEASLPEVTRCPAIPRRPTKPSQVSAMLSAIDGGQSIQLASNHTTILGRSPSSESNPPAGNGDAWVAGLGPQPHASREHIAILPRWCNTTDADGSPPTFWLVPIGRNGATVNKKWYLSTPVPLAPSDEITVCGRVFRFTVSTQLGRRGDDEAAPQ
jgi:hypothetical protein